MIDNVTSRTTKSVLKINSVKFHDENVSNKKIEIVKNKIGKKIQNLVLNESVTVT